MADHQAGRAQHGCRPQCSYESSYLRNHAAGIEISATRLLADCRVPRFFKLRVDASPAGTGQSPVTPATQCTLSSLGISPVTEGSPANTLQHISTVARVATKASRAAAAAATTAANTPAEAEMAEQEAEPEEQDQAENERASAAAAKRQATLAKLTTRFPEFDPAEVASRLDDNDGRLMATRRHFDVNTFFIRSARLCVICRLSLALRGCPLVASASLIFLLIVCNSEAGCILTAHPLLPRTAEPPQGEPAA